FNPETTSTASRYLSPIEAAASALNVVAVNTPVRDAVDIAHAIDAFAAEPNGGLLILPPPPDTPVRSMILQLAEHHKLPTMAEGGFSAAEGALMTYGPNRTDLYRSSASYVDRILRGAKPAELPVQFPTRFELVINMRTARSIGLTIPESFLLRAD